METEASVTHGTFVIERVYAASPARVFAAWADPAAKVRWFHCHDDWEPAAFELDFRVGGQERLRTGPAGGPAHVFEARYHDIVPDRCILYVYDMYLDDTRISVSLVTVAIEPARAGTRLAFTEQGAFFDGHANAAEREEGTRIGLDNLGSLLR